MADIAPALDRPAGERLLDRLRQALGAEAVSADEALRALYSQDIWAEGSHVADAVVSPRDTAALAEAVRLTAAEHRPLAVRGGGMSYTQGYAVQAPGAVLIDLSRMDRVLRVSADDMTVTVQAGCTWKTLLETLKPLGLRTPFWGPLSGISSTVGGGVSQHNAIFGAGRYGTTCESVVALTVVLADGRVLRTGAQGRGGETPFYRFFGPDLTGVFCGDTGAFGVKAEITLRLIRAPACEGYAAFAFDAADAALRAAAEIARAEVASECFGFDPALARARLKRASLLADVRTLGHVAARQQGWLKGVQEAAKVALAGRSFVGDDRWSIHLASEGRSQAAVDADLAEARRIALAAGGREIENSIPKIMRAQPFTPLNNVLGPGGERWVPVHGIVALSDASACYAAIQAEFQARAAQFATAGVETGAMLTTLSTNGFLIEPVFFWPEARLAIHEATVEPAMLARLPRLAPNPEATALVAEARRAVVEVFQRFGAAHFQVGRTYPYRENRDAASRDLLDAVKAAVDPQMRLNPGGLGFPADA